MSKNFHIVERTVSYVLVPGDSGLSEQLFLEQQEQSMSKELEHRLERRLSPEDETRLPEEFNALIIKCNSALREAQRMVKVYSWDDLDFKSVYVLPSLDFSVVPSYLSRRIPYRKISKDKPAVFGRMINGDQYLVNLDYKQVSPIIIERDLLRNYFDEAELWIAEAKVEATDSPRARKAMIDDIFRFTDIVYIIGGAGYGKSLFLKNLCVSPPEYM